MQSTLWIDPVADGGSRSQIGTAPQIAIAKCLPSTVEVEREKVR